MTETESAVASLPPSAKLVYKTLQYEGPMTQAQLAEASLLPQRTVRHALKKLDAVDAVEESVYLMDARKSNYRIPESEADEPGTETVTA
jgi:DNA-binding MarR family transcriptional regulator